MRRRGRLAVLWVGVAALAVGWLGGVVMLSWPWWAWLVPTLGGGVAVLVSADVLDEEVTTTA